MRILLENKEKKAKPETITQLVIPRFPPLWSGQEYDRWRVEVENGLITTNHRMKRSI